MTELIQRTFPDLSDDDLHPYRWTAVPVSERQHPSCGTPGSGRNRHKRLGEPICDVCNRCEAEYSRAKRERIA